MALRILLLLFSIIIASNLIILLISFLCGVNLYEKHKTIIKNSYLGFILLIVIMYIIMAILGLV